MRQTKIEQIVFGLLLLLVTGAFIWLIRGFLQPIFWAVALGILVYPAHIRLNRRLPGRETLTAGLSMLLVVIIVILPMLGVIAAVTNEAAALYQRLDEGDIDLAALYRRAQDQMPQLVALLDTFGVDAERIQSQLSSWAVQSSRFVAQQALSIGQNTVRIAIFFFLMVYLLFFFLRDGQRLLDGLVRALPLGDERERHLLERFAEVSRATIKGTFVIAILQGAIGGVTFALLGISAPVLWGVIMAFLSIIPAVGPALVWVPAAIVLVVNGDYIAAAILVAVGAFVIGLVDNLLRPVLVGRDTRMPDYLILLATLGGLTAFGLAGVVIGPIIAAFFISVWQMAEEEYGGTDAGPFDAAGDAQD